MLIEGTKEAAVLDRRCVGMLEFDFTFVTFVGPLLICPNEVGYLLFIAPVLLKSSAFFADFWLPSIMFSGALFGGTNSVLLLMLTASPVLLTYERMLPEAPPPFLMSTCLGSDFL